MAKVEIKLNYEGVGELLKSPEIEDICRELAQGVADRAGDGFEVNTYVGARRVNAGVEAATPQAYYRNMRTNALLKALGGG